MSNQTLPDIRKTQLFNAPIEKVWQAVATAEGLGAWFMPNNMVAETGHEFMLQAGPFGESPCKVTEVDPPNKLSFKWGKDWTLTFELADRDGKTEFTLIHSGWSEEQLTEFGESHNIVRGRMDGGWTGLVKKLGGYVEA